MTDATRKHVDILNKVSRRNLLRNSAMAATGAVLLPSFITGCGKDDNASQGSLGGLEEDELAAAAQNLLNMHEWIQELYPYCIEYETIVFTILESGEKPSGWHDFILDILSEIAVGMLEDAVDVIPGAGAAVAIAGNNIKTWLSNSVPDNLDAAYVDFLEGHNDMQDAIANLLLQLADIGHTTDPQYPYQNLKDGFKVDINFNGKTYSLSDLATSHFPTKANGDDYVTLKEAAYKKFKQDMWNVMLIKTGTMYPSSDWSISCDHFVICPNQDAKSPSKYAAEEHYPNYPATYLRGRWSNDVYRFIYWYIEVDGNELSAQAAQELFQDDYPGHITNSKGLFLRDYVFKQFHREKPDFSDLYGFSYHELLSSADDPCCSDTQDFNRDADNFDFTGGDFPMLIH